MQPQFRSWHRWFLCGRGRRRFGGDGSVAGRTLLLGSVPHVIIGVVGPDFDSEQFQPRPDLWVPLQTDPEHVDGASIYQVTARLRPGVTTAAADAHLRVAFDALNPGAATAEQGERRYAWTARPLREAMVGSFRSSINLLFGAVGILLLIACANVASLVLVRANVQKRGIAIRAAIGAGHGRIVRQLLMENVVLSLAGGAAGLLIGPWLCEGS